MNIADSTKELRSYLDFLKVERGLSDNTICAYRIQLSAYVGHLAKKGIPLLMAKPADISEYLEHKYKSGCKSSSRFVSTIALKSLHRYLKDREHADEDPAAGLCLPKVRRNIPSPMSVQEVESLINQIPPNSRFSLIRMKAMLECLYSTGMRVSELVNINVADINFEENWIRVLGKGNKFRDVPIGPKAKEAIAVYLGCCRERFNNCDGKVFLNRHGKKLTRGGFWKQLRQLSLLGNITGRVYPHRIRHSTASHLLSNGVDIRVLQELLGHSSITTTQIYTHVTPALLKAKVESAHPRF